VTAADLLLVGAKVFLLLLGSSIALVALMAYRRTGARLMAFLSVGFALLAVGSFVEGLLFEFLGWDLLTVHLLESIFVLAGLSVLVVALRPGRSQL
jgi:hypothetical protein